MIDPHAPEPRSDGLIGLGGESDAELPARSDAMYFAFGKRAFLGYWVQPNGRPAWFANLPSKQFMSTTEARAIAPEAWLARLREAYAGDVPGEQLVSNTSAKNLFVLGSTDMLPEVPRWHRGRMVLVGDAAHAPNHSSGQGVSLAVESAVELARCLRDIDDTSRAFATYEGLRRPRVSRIAAEAARTNQRKAAGPGCKRGHVARDAHRRENVRHSAQDVRVGARLRDRLGPACGFTPARARRRESS